MQSVLSGEHVEIIHSDLTSNLACRCEDGHEIELNGKYLCHGVEISGDKHIVWGVFTGLLEIEGVLTTVRIDFKDSSGTIEIAEVEEIRPPIRLLRSNASYAVIQFPNGEESFILRDLELPWDSETGVYGTKINDKLFLFILQ